MEGITSLRIKAQKAFIEEAYKMKKFNQYQIKTLMALLMVTDHLNHVPGLIPDSLAMIFHVLTRCVGVWFAYGAVEGVIYSHNIQRYILRLYGAAAVMFAGSKLLEILFAAKNILIANNIFLTLALGVTMLSALKYIKNKPLSYLVAVAAFSVGFIVTEGGSIVLPFMLISYYTYKKPIIRNACYFVLSIILFAGSFVPYETIAATISMLAYNSDFMFILVIPFLYMYNGEHGPHANFSKNFFYVFYPAHLWLLATIAYYVS